MHIISRMLVAVVAWLNAPIPTTEQTESRGDWADLPTYHPTRD